MKITEWNRSNRQAFWNAKAWNFCSETETIKMSF